MTIAREVRDFNRRLTYLERCAEMAPEGTYERAREAVAVIDDVSDTLVQALRERGFKVLNGDQLRNIEAAVYGYLLEANPDESGLIVGEGFGEHIDGPAGERVMANTLRDLNSINRLLARA